VEFTRCRFVRPERGIWVRHKPADGLALRFEDCDLIDPAPSHPTTAPVTLSAQRGAKHPVGGLELRNLTVTDALGRVPLALDGWAGGLGVQKVSGRLRLRGKDGAEEIVELTPERLAAWLPESALIGILPYPATPLRPLEPGADPTAFGLAQAKVRGRGTWLIHASAGDSVRCTLRYGQVGSYAGEPMPATVTAPSGAVAASVKAAFKADTELSFEARETGLYRLVADAGRNHVALSASSHPASVTADGEPLAFIAAAGTLWFWVPADVATFAVVCAGDGQEGVRASLLDAGGRLVEERDNISRPHQFVVKRAPGAAGEAWQLRLAKPSALAFEDFVVQLQGVPPLLAGARQGLLTPAP